MRSLEFVLRAVLLPGSLVAIGCTADPSLPGQVTQDPDGGSDLAPDAAVSDPRPALLAQLAAAELTWSTSQAICPSYHYVRSWGSVFGSVGITTVQVTDGNPSWRRHWSGSTGSGWYLDWTEGASQIGTNSTFEGFFRSSSRGISVPQLYAECREIFSADPGGCTFVLETNEQGVPVRCLQTFRGCVDDCSSGFSINKFECGTQDPCLGPGCPGSGPYDYACSRASGCDVGAVCAPLSDGTSCGAGTCTQGVCS